jgi:hypothetical protein
MKLVSTNFLLHLFFWAIWIAFYSSLYKEVGILYFWDQLFFHIPIVVVFYFFRNYIMRRFTQKKGMSSLVVNFFIFLVVFYFYKYLVNYKFLAYLDYGNTPREFEFFKFLGAVTPFFIISAVIGIISFHVKEYFLKRRKLLLVEKDKLALLERNLKLQQENFSIQQTNLLLAKKQIETENAYLRAQINPHFLHNTLNFFFSKSLNAGAPDLAEAIMVLSDVMRFSLEAKPDENGRVVAAKELEHFNNVIKINEIRFSKKYVIDYKVEGDMEKVKIIPLVLITMVENAFKYGELFDPQNPLQIHISAVNNRFRFHLRNKKRTGGTPEPSHGIGVANSIQRLKAAYGENGYSITIEQDEVFYAVTFVINDTTYVAPAVLSEATSKYESELATSTN